MMTGFLPPAYFYMNGFVLAMGVWSLISYESAEAMFMVSSHLGSSTIVFVFILCKLGSFCIMRGKGGGFYNSYMFCARLQ